MSGLNLRVMTAEAEVRLVHSLFVSTAPREPRSVVFCGVEHKDGCTRVCARAAQALTQMVDGSVCVVDANLRSPSLHKWLDMEQVPGFTEAIFSRQPVYDFVHPLAGGNCWALTCGFIPPNPHTVLTSPRIEARLRELESSFDYILIDAPPVQSYADAALLGQITDGIVLVLEAQATRRETALRAKRSLEATGAPVLAVVFNKRTFPTPERIYRKL